MMRCSQPMVGKKSKRCKQDEFLLNKTLTAGKKGHIYDLRDVSVLKSATQKGGGFESDSNYSLWKRSNYHLDRYDTLHSSFSKLVEVCYNDNGTTSGSNMNDWLNKFDSIIWFKHIRQALHIACLIADELHNKNGCILVHGWDGNDNTLLVTSLVQIILNPECRTIKGFQWLIEKEWLQAGHPFSERCFKSAYGVSTRKNEGPIFVVFLDSVRSLMEHYPLSFEFNEDFLIELFDHAYTSKFGTFLGNSEKEREQLMLKTRTVSLWTYLSLPDVKKRFTNVLYEINLSPIWPGLYVQSTTLWSSLFLRFQRNEMPYEETKNEIIKLVNENKETYQRLIALKK
jgi:myotubularin-related protein 9